MLNVAQAFRLRRGEAYESGRMSATWRGWQMGRARLRAELEAANGDRGEVEAEREACAKIADDYALDLRRGAANQETADLADRMGVYAKHVERVARWIRQRGANSPPDKGEAVERAKEDMIDALYAEADGNADYYDRADDREAQAAFWLANRGAMLPEERARSRALTDPAKDGGAG
jgi:hypothetical protein